MRYLNRPSINVSDILDVFKENTNRDNVKLDIESSRTVLNISEIIYRNKVEDNTLFEIERNCFISDRVNREDMIRYYEYRLLSKPSGKAIYDELLLSARHSECPYCTIRMVSTIDHFLPKSEYPNYTITPVNLVPACRDCNMNKNVTYSTSENDQVFHPYFDLVENLPWIKAELIQSEPLSFRFIVKTIEQWSAIKNERAIIHFNEFSINELFSNESNRELRSSQFLLKNHHREGIEMLREHLCDAYISSLRGIGLLYWKTLMYQELSSNEWFLNGCEGNSFFQD